MTDHELEQRLRDWYVAEIGTTEAAPPSLYHSLAGIPEAIPLQHRPMPVRRRVLLLAAAALLATLVAGAVAVGSGLVKLPAILPAPSAAPSVQASPSASAAPSVQASPSATASPQVAVVAYTMSNRIWVVNADGTDAHELLTHEPDYQNWPDVQYPVAWSPDGSRLYYQFARYEFAGPEDGIGSSHGGLAATDAAGSEPEEWDLSTLWCHGPGEGFPCQPNDRIAVSPDGTRLAYAVQEGESSTIVILNIARGQISRLESTRTQNPGFGPEGTVIEEPCASDASQGYNELPSWSPDGTRLVFARQVIGPRVNGFCQSTIFTVNVDGSDLRRLVPPDVPAVFPSWSPDGSTILFHAGTPAPTGDIYSVRPDGTGLQALTSDGVSFWPHWTRDGRVVFIRELTPDTRGVLWVMDAGGGNASQIDPTIPALTAAGCLICPFPNDQGQYWAENRLNQRFWQPLPADQP